MPAGIISPSRAPRDGTATLATIVPFGRQADVTAAGAHADSSARARPRCPADSALGGAGDQRGDMVTEAAHAHVDLAQSIEERRRHHRRVLDSRCTNRGATARHLEQTRPDTAADTAALVWRRGESEYRSQDVDTIGTNSSASGAELAWRRRTARQRRGAADSVHHSSARPSRVSSATLSSVRCTAAVASRSSATTAWRSMPAGRTRECCAGPRLAWVLDCGQAPPAWRHDRPPIRSPARPR